MNEKLKALMEVVKENKSEALKAGACFLGAIVGLVVVAIATRKQTPDNWNPDLEPDVTVSGEPQPTETV
jgi:hypothetical protein